MSKPSGTTAATIAFLIARYGARDKVRLCNYPRLLLPVLPVPSCLFLTSKPSCTLS